MKLILAVVFVVFNFLSLGFCANLPSAKGQYGMVVTDQALASRVGLNILKQGGNAIDAAVAVGYALAVVQPCCGNIGGGGFMLIHLADGKNRFINFREKAPSKISDKLFQTKRGKLSQHRTLVGYLTVGVPGTVMGLNMALNRYGTMPLATVIKPAIRLARQGYVLTKQDVHFLNYADKFIKNQKNVAAIFMPTGRPLHVGQRLIQTQLASSLDYIKKYGTAGFYRGRIAKEIVAASQQHGGVLSLKDFANYKIKIEKPIICFYQNYKIITGQPPSSGVTVCEILNILNGFPLSKWGFHSVLSSIVNFEAMRYAFYDRNNYLGDPNFILIPIKMLLSEQYAEKIQQKIATDLSKYHKQYQLQQLKTTEKRNTTHYSIIDKFGNAVAVTYTLNGLFGSKVIAGNTGFFLNNELNDFTLKKNVPNQFRLKHGMQNLIAPNKQPLSSMSPTIVLKKNKPFLILGAAGGPTIITTIVETIQNVIDYRMDLNAAVNEPRFHMQGWPNIVYIEPNVFNRETLKILQSLGYQFKVGFWKKNMPWGQMAAIEVDSINSIYYGVNDQRRPGGLAIGY